MTEFEFIFGLYALVLGLSFVELIAGLGRTVELAVARDASNTAFRIGWLTPLLAVFVLLDLLSFWAFAWAMRDHVGFNLRALLGTVAFAGSYYLAARLVFPSEPQGFADLDVHYFRIRRIVLGILMALVFVQLGFMATIPQFQAAVTNPLALGYTLLLVVLMALAMWLRSARASAIVLSLMIARYLLAYLA